MDVNASVFSERKLAYPHGERRLGRTATVAKGATPHVVPVGRTHNELDTIDVGGRKLERRKKYRDAAGSGRAAIVIDLASVDPWWPQAIEVRGAAEAIDEPRPLIRIHPERIVSWGIDTQRGAHTVLAKQR